MLVNKSSKREVAEFIAISKEKEAIELGRVFKVIYSFKSLLFLFMGTFAVLGLVKSLTFPDEYISSSMILTEQTMGFAGGGLGALSSSLPNMLGSGRNRADADIITPDIYPHIITNDDLLLKIARDTFYFKELDLDMSLTTYFSEYEERDVVYKVFSLPRRLIRLIKGSSSKPVSDSVLIENQEGEVFKISVQENIAINRLLQRIEVDKQDRLIEIKTKMPDDVVAAVLNQKVVNELRDFVQRVNTDREKQNLDFVEFQTQIARENFEKAQMDLAVFRDQNYGVISQKIKSREQRLQSEYDLTFQLYNSMAMQFEQAKLKFQEAKPVLTVFQTPKIPLSPSEPTPVLTTIIFAFLGFFIGLFYVFYLIVKEYFTNEE